MKAASLSQIKKELENLPESEHKALILKLARFKKDNKELLTYLLFEVQDENGYIQLVMEGVDSSLLEINTSHVYYIKKTCRKVLRNLKKQIRYSGRKETEATLLLHFCFKLKELFPMALNKSAQLQNMLDRQKALAHKAILSLHEDLQYDLLKEYNEL